MPVPLKSLTSKVCPICKTEKALDEFGLSNGKRATLGSTLGWSRDNPTRLLAAAAYLLSSEGVVTSAMDLQ